MQLPRVRRYWLGARWYDRLSMERLVYRTGRSIGIDALGLNDGDRVLDLGCGTGLSFPAVVASIGTSGRLIGVDASASMLSQARRRIAAGGWANVTLRHGDASVPDEQPGSFDAVLFTYSLSVITEWHAAWERALKALAPGGRVLVVDTALPTGRWRVLWPLARLACLSGGVHVERRPWRLVRSSRGIAETGYFVLKGGHVHVAVGRRDWQGERP